MFNFFLDISKYQVINSHVNSYENNILHDKLSLFTACVGVECTKPWLANEVIILGVHRRPLGKTDITINFDCNSIVLEALVFDYIFDDVKLILGCDFSSKIKW